MVAAEEVPLGVAILGVEVRSEAVVAVRDSKRLRVKMQALGLFPALFLWGTLRYFHHILLHLLRGTTIFQPNNTHHGFWLWRRKKPRVERPTSSKRSLRPTWPMAHMEDECLRDSHLNPMAICILGMPSRSASISGWPSSSVERPTSVLMIPTPPRRMWST